MATKKKKRGIPKYVLIRDTREKEGHGWDFDLDEFCAGTEHKKLDEGDYTIQGMEHLFRVERKGCISEFAGNIGKHRARFYREIERLKPIKYKFIVIEEDFDTIANYHLSNKITPNYIISNIISLQVKHGIQVVFVGKGKRADLYIRWLFHKMWEYFVNGRL